MSEWYYTSAGQQTGPVTSAQLKQAAQSGQLTPNDLVWKDGMPDWVPATKLKGIFDGASAAAAAPVASIPASAPAPAAYDVAPTAPGSPEVYAPHATAPQQQYGAQPGSQIGYYNPTAGLSQRVAQMFRADMRQDVIQRAVALKDRQSPPFRNERAPDCLSQQVTGQLHQACERIVGMQDGITGEHRPLRESSDDCLLVVDLELLG